MVCPALEYPLTIRSSPKNSVTKVRLDSPLVHVTMGCNRLLKVNNNGPEELGVWLRPVH
jgi:hypothetical protein